MRVRSTLDDRIFVLLLSYGTDLAARLRARKFDGFVVIRSAISGEDDFESFLAEVRPAPGSRCSCETLHVFDSGCAAYARSLVLLASGVCCARSRVAEREVFARVSCTSPPAHAIRFF